MGAMDDWATLPSTSGHSADAPSFLPIMEGPTAGPKQSPRSGVASTVGPIDEIPIPPEILDTSADMDVDINKAD
jgi:hypothetical protein